MRRLVLAITLLAVIACDNKQPTTPDAHDQWDIGASPASAPQGHRLTRGDAEAVIDAFGTAGFLILAKNGLVPVPAAPSDKGAIRPVPFFDGRHYCTLDWLVPVLALFDYDDVGAPQRSPTEIRAGLASSSIALSIDGEPFVTRRTPVKPWNGQRYFFGVNAFGYQVGELVAPGTFSDGAHVLHSDVYFGGAWYASEITFYIDDAASATCTG